MLEELIVIASIGTGRKPPALSSADPALNETFALIADAPAEAKLLSAVAVLSQYESCGREPASAPPSNEPAAPETRPVCTRRAADLLSQILAMTNTDIKEKLANEWLQCAAQTSRRVPHRLLPALLNYGAFSRNSRNAISEVIGTRGAWLMRLNPQWQFAAAEGEDPRLVWNTGKRDQRLAAITRLRQTEPAAARELIQSTWKEDAADDRASFAEAMLTSLGPEDEPFLESALDDRSKVVRAAAADLLARLPDSAYVRRMIERAEPLLQLNPARTVGSSKKARVGVVNATLPKDAFDLAWARDGIIEKPENRMGRRQWWLFQLIAAIPPSFWSTKWNYKAHEIVAAATDEFFDVLLTAWNKAADRYSDAQWISALLLTAAKEGRGTLNMHLLNKLPADAQQAVTAEILESVGSSLEKLSPLLTVAKFSFGKQCATILFRQIEQFIEQKSSPGYNYILPSVLQETAVRVPPEFYGELAERWTGPKWEPNRKAADDFFSILQIRRDLQREFVS